MFYSATLLDPFPFDWARISAIALTGAVSFGLAYLSGARFKEPWDTDRLRFRQIILKPPLIIWVIFVLVMCAQVATVLDTLHWIQKK
jgi:hypothetical protein